MEFTMIGRPVGTTQNADDLLGKTYGQITVRSVERIGDRWWYTVDCLCGGTNQYRRDQLIMGQRSSCGCGQEKQRKKRQKLIFDQTVKRIRANALRKIQAAHNETMGY